MFYGPAMARSRYNITVIGGLGLLALLAVVGWRYALPGYQVVISTILWGGIWLYLLGTLFWVGLNAVGMVRYTEPSNSFGHDDIQVRIMTIDAEDVVQETVDALPDTIIDRHVISESSIDVEGAEVHVVPNEFTCDATRKGRALEWARRTLTCNREYILYLDEDTIVTEFDGLPDADIVQFGERPYRTGGLVPYLSEMFRVGFQLEQRTFGLLPVPLYAWGGGIAIRSSLEQRVTWDYDTLIEDTVFTWRAVMKYDASFVTVRTLFYNQAPATIGAMISQRRRWIGGAEKELWRLPWYCRPLFRFRNVIWGLTPIASVIPLITLFFPGLVLFEQLYVQFSFALLITPLLWSILGFDYFQEIHLVGGLLLPLTPLITIVHSAGAFLGLLSQPQQFTTTAKVGEAVDSADSTPIHDGGLSFLGWLRYHVGCTVSLITSWVGRAIKSLSSTAYSLLITGYADGRGLPFERRHIKLRPAAILAIITAVGTAVRFYGLAGASYWYDEIYSVAIRSAMPFGSLLTASEPHPPLYYLILKYWMSTFGQSEFATRTLSALFGVGAIIAIYFLCKELFSRSAGYIGAALMALSTFNIHASQTARMYEPLTFFTIVSLYFLLRVLDDGGYRHCTLYALSSIAVLFTHLFGSFVILAQNLYVLGLLLAESERRWKRLKRWLVIEGLVSVLYLSFLLTVLRHQLLAKASGGSKANWITVSSLNYLKDALLAIGGAPFQYPFANFSSFSTLVSCLFLAVATIAIILGILDYKNKRSDVGNGVLDIRFAILDGRGKLLGISVFICCFVFPYVLSFVITPMFVIRYLAPATVGAIVLIAGSVATIRRDSVRVAVMLALLVSSAGLVGVYHQTSTAEDWRTVSDYIESSKSTDPLLILQPAWIHKPLTFYGLPSTSDAVGIYRGKIDFGPANARGLRQTIRTHNTIYIVRRKPSPIDSLVEKIAPTHRKASERDFGGVTVYKYVRR
jgi:uncharacterized membrane protein